MVFLRYIFVLVVLQISSLSWAQINFHRVYAGDDYDFGYDLFQTEDTSYYLCGASSSFIDAPSQALLMKVDSLGDILWSRTYGVQGSNAFLSMDDIEDYAIFAGGYTTSNAGDFDAYLVKLDFNGDILWDTVFGETGWERIVDVEMTQDSGVVVLSSTNSPGLGGMDWWIHALDKDGNVLWNEKYGGAFEDEPKDMALYGDTIFACGGHYIEDSLMTKAVVYKLNRLTGQTLHVDTLPMLTNTMANAIHVMPTRLLFTGSAFSQNPDSLDMVLGVVKFTGEFAYTFREVREGSEESNCFTPSYDSTFIFINKQAINSPSVPTYSDGEEDSQMYRFEASLNYLGGSVNYSDLGQDRTTNMIATNDGGMAYVGFQEKYTNFKSSVVLVKIGPNGEAVPIQNPNISDILGAMSSIVEVEAEQTIKVYPNPFNNELSIDNFSNENLAIEVVTSQGVVINKLLSKETQIELDMSAYTSGVYFLRVVSEEKTYFMKIVKM